eukprot:15485443-Alexandrium_andersonii.AAC.1
MGVRNREIAKAQLPIRNPPIRAILSYWSASSQPIHTWIGLRPQQACRAERPCPRIGLGEAVDELLTCMLAKPVQTK